MPLKKTFLIPIIIVVLAMASLSLYVSLQAPLETGPENVEQPSEGAEIVFKTVDSEEVTIEDLLAEDKPVLIYFFATWCPICEQDLKNLNMVYGERKWGVNVLVVGFDPTESAEQIRTYKEKRSYVWPFAEYNKDAIIEYEIISQSTKVGVSTNSEVVFSRGYGVVGEGEWRDLLQRLESG